jgi:phosphate acetyltransferase
MGSENRLLEAASKEGLDLNGAEIIDPSAYADKDRIIDGYYELRKSKGITRDEAKELLLGNHVFFAAMMTRLDLVDGFVAGACHTTSDVARSAIHCLTIDREIGTVCSSFIIEFSQSHFGENGLFAYGDCAVIPNPSSRQLSGIAIATSDMFYKLFEVEPRVAMLSYSTKGSARSEAESIVRIQQALKRIKGKRDRLMIDGEMQVDAALVPEVAGMKCPDSPVAGKANVLIFPNLDAGNIAYKLSQRLGGARAVGPLIHGLDKPCSDLSRGCSWEDVVDTTVITAIRAQKMEERN